MTWTQAERRVDFWTCGTKGSDSATASSIFREQCWRSGESTGLPPMWPGFDSQIRRHMWVESLLREVFPRVLWFSPLTKKNQHLIWFLVFPISIWRYIPAKIQGLLSMFKFIIQHSSLTFNIQVYHSTFKFIIQHSSFKLNFTDEWLTFGSESARSHASVTRDIDRSMAARVEWIQMLQTQDHLFYTGYNVNTRRI